MERDTYRIILALGLVVGIVAGSIFIPVLAQTVGSFLSPDVPVDGEIPVGHPDGATVFTHTNSEEMDLSNFTSSDRLYISTSTGNISVYSNGDTEMDVFPGQNLTGQWTNLTQITAGSTWIETYPVDKQRVDVRGDVTALSIADISLGDGLTDLWYSGVDGGTVSTKLHDLPSDMDVTAIDSTTGSVLDRNTTDASGMLWLDLPASSHGVELIATEDTGTPTVTNTGPDETAVDTTTTLSADVDDEDFPDDTVSVDLVVDNRFEDNTVVNTTSVSSQSTVSFDYTFNGATESDYYFVAEDQYNNSATSGAHTVYSLGNLSLSNEVITINSHEFGSPGSVDFTIDRYDTGWMNLSSMSAGSDWIQLNPNWMDRVDVRGDVTELDIRSMTINDGVADFRYAGTDGGVVSMNVHGLQNNTNIAAVDVATNTVLDTGTSSDTGVVSFDLPSSSHTVELLSQQSAPEITDASPTGPVNTQPDFLRANVSDDDFPNDAVNVTMTFEGAVVHETTVTEDRTVITDNFTADTLGKTYLWGIQAQDEYGTWTNETYSFGVPDDITLLNETRPNQLITGKNATFTFYEGSGPYTITRNDSDNDGSISLEGLPNTEFVVDIQIDDYYDRRIYIDSIFDQQYAFLLNSTAFPLDSGAVFTEFQLDDRTGNFPPGDSVLKIQRALNVSTENGTQWMTVSGDFFGATNRIPFIGEYQSRYRLMIQNQDGDRRVLGSYTPTVGGLQTIPIGSIGFSGGDIDGDVALQGALNDTEAGYMLTLLYNDLENATTQLDLTVYNADDDTQIFTDTVSVGVGALTLMYNMSARDPTVTGDSSYRIEWTATRDGYDDESGEALVGTVQQFDLPIPEDSLNMLMWFFLFAIAGVTALYDAKLSMVTTPIVALGMTIVGVISIPAVLVSIALIEGLLFYFGEGQNVP